ncbi:MAG: PEGA domain-containing protein [Candidatus Saccharibacteria bacterium]|nr:PEGA domain-containing protein [Candidatus Saccharibacteria bacterium]
MEYQGNQNNHHMPVVYIILGVIFFTVIIVAVSMILGYRLNLKENKVDVVGRLQLNITPNDSKVLIDGKELSWLDGNSISLTEGSHVLEISKNGYTTWRDQVHIKGSSVKWLNVRLFADQIDTKIIKNYPALLDSNSASHHNFIINQLAKNEFELVDLNGDEAKYTTLKLNDFYPGADKFDFGFLKWNLENDSLFFQDLKSEHKQTILINYKKPKLTVDLTDRYKDSQLTFQDFKITGPNNNLLWLLENQKLYRINLSASDTQPELIAERVKRYSAIDENKVAFIQDDFLAEKKIQHVQIYNYKELRYSLVDRVGSEMEIDIMANRLDLKDYVIYKRDNHLMVMQAENEFYNLKSPELVNDSTDSIYQTFLDLNPNVKTVYSKYFNQATRLIDHNNNQFAVLATQVQDKNHSDGVVKAGIEWFVYDISNEESFKFADSSIHDLTSVKANWLDNAILWHKNEVNSFSTRYFNGRNQITLNNVLPKYAVRFDKSQKNLYYIANNQDGSFDLIRAKIIK